MRLILLPLTGRLPVIAQILAMMVFDWLKGDDKGAGVSRSKVKFDDQSLWFEMAVHLSARCVQDLKFLPQVRRVEKMHHGKFALAQPRGFRGHKA